MPFRRCVGLVVLTAVLSPWLPLASGQEERNEEDESRASAGWDGDHPYVGSADGGFRLELRGRMHLDYRAYSADFAPASSFLARRARIEVKGVLFGIFEFKLQPDFADDEAVLLRDGFLNIHAKDVVQVMAGQFKAPFSQEEFIQSSNYMGFVERSMLNNIAPGRSPGVMVHGVTTDEVLQYFVSFQNDEGELQLNHKGSPDLFARVRFEPWREGVLDTLSFGGALGLGNREEERFVTGRTSSRSIVFFDEVPLDGRLVRRNVEGWWYPGRLLIQAEYDDLVGERRGLGEDGSDLPDIETRGMMVQALYVLTGEHNTPLDPIVPARPVREGGPGAWEIGLRYQFFDVTNTNRADELAVGVNWWLNRFVRYQSNFSWETFRGPPDPSTGETSNFAFLSRIQVYF